jgi:hypothetical protein
MIENRTRSARSRELRALGKWYDDQQRFRDCPGRLVKHKPVETPDA